MTLDGVAAVQARIAQIQALVSGTVSAAGVPARPAVDDRHVATAVDDRRRRQSPEFASLLADAMAIGRGDDRSALELRRRRSSSIGGSSMSTQLLSQLAPAARHLDSRLLGGRSAPRRPATLDGPLAGSGPQLGTAARDQPHRAPSGHGTSTATPIAQTVPDERARTSRASRTCTARPRRSATRTRRRSTAPSSRSGPRPGPASRSPTARPRSTSTSATTATR